MSLSILASRATRGQYPTPVSGEWTRQLQGPGNLAIRYAHTTRVAPSMIDLEGSDETSILAKDGPKIFSSTPTKEGGTSLTFSGAEIFWNNKLRCDVIADGIDRFVPQILYLIRPETAFTSCLHFLAREIGGIEGYLEQREFIIRNPGLTSLMPKFWQKVQETAWSGGFSPSLPKEDIALLILALMECFYLTPYHGGRPSPEEVYPCPHLPNKVLHEAGIYLPSIEWPEPVPTPQAHSLLTNTLSRANLPGTPTDLTSYIDCFVCGSHTVEVGETNRHKCIPVDQLKCTGCGLIFSTHDEYRIHALTFCRQGPITQGRCGCCNVKGPQCLCQQHWRKTYTLVASIMRGEITRARWLTPEYISLLIDARVFLSWSLIPPSTDPPGPSTTPFKLRDSLWDPTAAPLPIGTERDGECLFLSPDGDNPVPPETIQKELESSLGIDMKHCKTPQPKNQDKGLATEAFRQKFLGAGNITLENANAEDFNHLDEKVTMTSEKLADPNQAKVLASVLKTTIPELHRDLKELEDLKERVAMKLFLEEERKERREKLHFRSPVTSPPHPHEIGRQSSPVTSVTSERSPRISPIPTWDFQRRRSDQRASSKSPGRRHASRSPGARTTTSVRGSSKTHTMAMDLEKATSVLRAAVVDPKGTSYRRKYGDLKSAINKADQHLRYDRMAEVDPAYSESLEDLIETAEDLLDRVDEESDQISASQDETRRREAQIAKCLPRSQPQKWDGSVNDFIRFKTSAKVLMEHIPNPRLALNAIIESISDPRLKKRLARYATPQEALSSLELEYGNPELSGPKIISDMKSLSRATGVESESSLILKIKELHVALKEIKQEHLLGRNELYNLCHKFRERQGEELLDILYTEKPDKLRDVFFQQLEKLYTKNTIWSRTNVEKESHPRPRNAQRGKTSNLRVNTSTRQCTFCQGKGHYFFLCPLLKDMTLSELKKKGFCHRCLIKHQGACSPKTEKFLCGACKLSHHKLTSLHVKCRGTSTTVPPRTTRPPPPQGQPVNLLSTPSGQATSSPTQALPLQEVDSSANRRHNAHSVRRDFAWRSPGGPIANPNPLNSAFEVVDHAIIQAPDGRLRRIRVLHDAYAADSTLADTSLESFSHRTGTLDFDLHTAIGTSRLQADEMVLKLILPDGSPRFLKTISTEMRAQKAFTITQKTIDLPPMWNSKHFQDQLQIGPNQNIRCLNFTEGAEIELLLGGDNVFLSPFEMDRYEDSQGGVILYRSPLQSELLLLGGSRIVGPSLVSTDGTSSRGFRLTTDNQEAIIRRTTVKEKLPVLFPENPLAKMSKLDQQFFREFEDSHLLLPHPRACKGCAECPTCSDASAAEKTRLIKEGLDQLCRLDTEKPWPEGGWHIKLMWNELKSKVPTNEQDALRRFLATERQISKSPSALLSFNEQVAKCLALGYFVLAKDYPHMAAMANKQASFLPLSYALKDTVDATDSDLHLDLEPTKNMPCPPVPKLAQGKTKARPVSDGSHKANAHTPSVNEALVPIPDLWTGKIQNLLIKFRTARRMAMADISQYFHRLRLDLDSVSMTRAVWRIGGIGGTGELTTMFVPSASMGLTPVPALASHCRARTADMMSDPVARESITHSYCDDVYLPTLWEQKTDLTKSIPPEPDERLLHRISETEEALSKAKLQLGDAGWVTDLDQSLIPPGSENVKGVTEQGSSRVIGLSTTGALGLRWNLGSHLPDGGTFSYRVHRPGSLNLLPKKRGKRPAEGELHNREDIQNFLASNGMTKAGLLRLVMNLFDVLQLALPWTATAKLLYREVLTENPCLGWKEKIPSKYHQRIENLAADLLALSKDQSFPRRALQEGPDGTIGHLTLIICHDGSADSAAALAYLHQQWPRESAKLPNPDSPDCTSDNIVTKVSLLCGAHKLTEHGHEEQVASELLSAVIAVKLKKTILDNSLVQFDRVIYLGDSLTVARVLRKSNRAYSVWAGTRVSYIQRNEDVDNMYHVPGTFLVPTADKATRSHSSPSTLMDDAYWNGTGTLDTPLHLLPITPQGKYTVSGLDELPREWLNKAAVRLNPVGLPATITCRRIEAEADDSSVMLQQSLQRLKVKYRSFDKIKRIMKLILSLSPAYKDMTPDQLWKLSERKWLTLDHDILMASLKVTQLPQTLLLQEDREHKVFYVQGRGNYRVPLLANPKKSQLTRIILKQFHDENHGASPALVQALAYKRFYVMGGAAAYIKSLKKRCFRCHILKPQPSMGLAGPPPEGTQGPLPSDKSIWRRWMLDICGPIILSPWAGKRATRSSQKNLKHWILVAVDLCSRQVDAVLLEGYSTSAVLTGLRELTANHGVPSDIYWDRASNLHAAAALLAGDEMDGDMDVAKLIKVQEQLKRSFETNGITVHLSIPYSSHRQGRVEAAVKRIKKQLVELAYDESQTKLTPMEVTSLLASACDAINNRPLLLTAESSLEEKHVLSPSYLTCSDLNLEKGGSGLPKCHQDIEDQKWFNMRESPLNHRAIMVQERLKIFKDKFDTFMTKSLTSLGKFNSITNPIKENDVVLILDKPKATLPVQCKKRFTLGVVEKMLSERSCVIRFISKSSSGNLRTDRCERSIQGLALLVQAQEAENVNSKDLVIDPLFPAGSLV